ncbi:pseudouridine synthase [Scheffersomyces amazonensis]|uniref:pseudouridine synthase n=1 Tax=Scheffersomyces amazonensis TaxID=1078765 RepID=UPI00315CC99B
MISSRGLLGWKLITRSFNSVRVNMKQYSTSEEYEKWSKRQLIERIRQLESIPKSNETDISSNSDVNIPPPKKQKRRVFDFSKYSQRFIALKFAYLGWNYNGLAYQFEDTPLPTVEETLLNALATAKLIENPALDSCDFSRCGRTDKGVSAMSQVISLKVRSALTEDEQLLKENDQKEIKYLSILNSILPSDIRITSICLRPPKDFDARFSCEYRHYRYLFKKDNLDLELMSEAAKKYEGVHDFRNFCKIDGSKQITNFNRNILGSQIIQLKDDLYAFDLKGSAFLWHQVRCMVAMLFLVAQKLEKPTLIDDMLNIEKYPAKPVYEMAHDIPLVLYDCTFPEMEWQTPSEIEDIQKFHRPFTKFKGLVTDYELKAHMAGIMSEIVLKDSEKILFTSPTSGNIPLGDGMGRNFSKYVPMDKREVGDTFDIVNERHKEKRKRKIAAKHNL